jgi:hypothetical protein
MTSISFPRSSVLRSDTAQSLAKARPNHGWRERQMGLDVVAENFDSPVKGEAFPTHSRPNLVRMTCVVGADNRAWVQHSPSIQYRIQSCPPYG